MFITWHTPTDGKHNGTIGCSNGHIQLCDVPKEKHSEHDDAVREMANAMPKDPGTLQQASAFLIALGAKKLELGNHTAFGPLPDGWKDKLSAAVGAVKGAPAPAVEPKTLEELKEKHPELLEEHAKEMLEPVKAAVAEVKDAIKAPAPTEVAQK